MGGQIQVDNHIVRERETYSLDGRIVVRFRLAVTSCESEERTAYMGEAVRFRLAVT
jgi:hypothetical protein